MICRLLNTLLCTIDVLASGCSQKIQETVKEDFISLTSTQATIDHTTQSIEITVSSSESWTIETFFASYDRSRTWVGLDLGERHIITKVGWSPRKEHQKRVELALYEGANKADFSDALPIHIVKEPGKNNTMEYAEVNCSRGFRYVRYVGPKGMNSFNHYAYGCVCEWVWEFSIPEGATASVTLPGSAETTEYGSGTYTLRRAL